MLGKTQESRSSSNSGWTWSEVGYRTVTNISRDFGHSLSNSDRDTARD